MTAAAVPVVESIEALDFDPDVVCEFSGWWDTCIPGTHPANWYVASHCSGPIPICNEALRRDFDKCTSGVAWSIRCVECGAAFPLQPYRVLGPVRS